MSITAGTISQVSVSSTTDSLVCTAFTAGTGPYTYQWYRDTSGSGFSPAGGNILSGQTALTLNDTGLIPNTVYYYKVVGTDTGHSNDQATTTALAVTTAAPTLSQNQFALAPYLGQIDLRFPYNTVSVQIGSGQATPLFTGAPVKIVTNKFGGVPKVVGCTASTDECYGFINYDIKTISYSAGAMAEISMNGNVMYLYATGAIARGAQVILDITNNGVASATGSTSDNIIGWAYDGATAMGQLTRVFLKTPSFAFDAT